MLAAAALNSGATRDWESAWLATWQTVPARPSVAALGLRRAAHSIPALNSAAAARLDWPANIVASPNRQPGELFPVARATGRRPWPVVGWPRLSSHSIQKFVPLAARALSWNRAFP